MHTTLGVDIGKDTLVVAWSDGSRHRARWPVLTLNYRDPDWWRTLVDLIAPGAVIVAEPTGWHYAAPLVAVVQQMTAGVLWFASHEASAAARQHFAAAKTDAMDARALAYIAEMIHAGDPPRNVRLFSSDLAAAILELRLWVNARARSVKEATRAKNQLAILGHSMWPELARRRPTWLGLVGQGIITPQQIRQFVADHWQTIEGRQLRFYSSLANDLPDVAVNPVIPRMIEGIRQRLAHADALIVEAEAELARIIHTAPLADLSRRWLTVPGATAEAVAALHVATHGAADTMTPDEFKAVCGVNPKSSSSGNKDKTRLTRKGYRPALNALWTWTMWMVNPFTPDNPVKQYHARKQDFFASRAKLARLICAVGKDPAGYQFAPSGHQIASEPPTPGGDE